MSKIYYFVDYENVHEAGITGMNKLPKDSEVHLFYSQNANKLNLDLLRFVKAKVRVHKVKPGKQSLDMQMVSYLGYCMSRDCLKLRSSRPSWRKRTQKEWNGHCGR